MSQIEPSALTLHAQERGAGKGAPIVLLHGFAGDCDGWTDIQAALAARHRSIAFDLPGHGRSLEAPVGHAGDMGRTVAAALDAMGETRLHLVGHSLGGAVAALMALREPQRIASLTLLAPGGFGPEINHRLLRRFAEAREEMEIQLLLEQFFGWQSVVPPHLARRMAEDRRRPGALEPLARILDAILRGDVQGTLPVQELGGLPCPVKVVWGTQDRVLPTRQAHRLPGIVAAHVFERIGHMVHLEAPEATVRLILENAAHG